MFEICRATSIKDPGFIQLLSQFLIERGQGVPDTSTLDRLEAAVRMDRIRFYMALDGDRVIGVISMTVSFSTMKMRPYAVFGDLYVHPGHRGRGCAAVLLLGAMDGAHEAGCSRIITERYDDMEGIFERYGWYMSNRLMAYKVKLDQAPPSLTITGTIVFD